MCIVINSYSYGHSYLFNSGVTTFEYLAKNLQESVSGSLLDRKLFAKPFANPVAVTQYASLRRSALPRHEEEKNDMND